MEVPAGEAFSRGEAMRAFLEAALADTCQRASFRMVQARGAARGARESLLKLWVKLLLSHGVHL